MEQVCNSPKVYMWSSIMLDQIAEPFFYSESTAMSSVYLDTMENFVCPWTAAEVENLIFQHDGSPRHFGATVCTALDDFLVEGLAGKGQLIGPNRVLP
jgi:hypothetical protein